MGSHMEKVHSGCSQMNGFGVGAVRPETGSHASSLLPCLMVIYTRRIGVEMEKTTAF